MLILSVIFSLLELGNNDANDVSDEKYQWNFNYFEYWSSVYPSCKGDLQSPVNIPSSLFSLNDPIKNYKLPGFLKGQTMIRKNQLIIKSSIEPGEFSFFFWDTEESYYFDELNSHFDCTSQNEGSEHSIEGKKLFGEMQFKFYNSRYNRENASNYKDGIIIISHFFEEKYIKKDLPLLAYLLTLEDAFSANPESILDVPEDSYEIDSLFLFIIQGKSVIYRGSLDYPPCSQTVIWIIFDSYLPIPVDMSNKIKTFLAQKQNPLCGKNRPIQRELNKTSIIS